MNLPLMITRPDIVPIVNRAWKKSFAVVKTNRKAIQERGWNPPNMALLHHPAIVATKDVPPLGNTAETPIVVTAEEEENNVSVRHKTPVTSVAVMENLNFHSGVAGEVITDVLMWAKDNETLKDNVRKRVEERKTFYEKTKEVKRLSPGFFFTNRKLAVTSDDVYLAVKQRSDARLEKEKEAVRKALKDRVKMEGIVKKILSDAKGYIVKRPDKFPNAPPQDRLLTFEEIPTDFLTGTMTKTLLRFMTMKKKGDKGLSKLNTAEAKARWTEMCMRAPHSTKEFLIEEKGYRVFLVEAVMAEPPTNTAITEGTAVSEMQGTAQQQPIQLPVFAEASSQHRDESNELEGGVSL